MEGVCSNLLGPLTCLATCSPDDGSNYPDSNETSCVNSNSVCQATGMLGDAATLGVCIPANRFQAASDCPGGSFAVDNGDGTFDCIPPSGIGCNIEDATDNGAVDLSTTGSTCSFSHGGHALIGVCSAHAGGSDLSRALQRTERYRLHRVLYRECAPNLRQPKQCLPAFWHHRRPGNLWRMLPTRHRVRWRL